MFVDSGVPAPLRRWIPLAPVGPEPYEGAEDADSMVEVPARREDGTFGLATAHGVAILTLHARSLEAAFMDIFGTFGL